MEDFVEGTGKYKVSWIVKGIIIAMCLTLVFTLILSIILSFSDIKESIIMPSVIFISSFSILVGAFMVARKINKNGIAYGSLLGLLYMLILYFISSIMNFNFSLSVNSIIMIVFGIIGGAVGGILGVNLK